MPRHDGGMRIFDEHPRARWAAPVAAAAVVGAATFTSSHLASADPSLPHRSAAQLLVDVQKAGLTPLSGTIVQTANLGLPELPGIGAAGGDSGHGTTSLTSMLSGTHTWRVWYASPQQARLALVGGTGETDVIRNGKDLWVWSSSDKSAAHHVLSQADQKMADQHAPGPSSTLPRTPQEAAQQALAAMGPTTDVTTSGTASVAGRSAYELVLKPRDNRTLVASVRIAIDAARHVPLRVQVFSTKIANPAFEVGFTHVDFGKPAARQFAFNPPPGTKVTTSDTGPGAAAPKVDAQSKGPEQVAPKAVGTGWTTVVVAHLPSAAEPGTSSPGGADQQLGQLQAVLKALPKVSGAWGSGRLLTGTLFSAVLTDDGRVAVGAVAPSQLYAALAAR